MSHIKSLADQIAAHRLSEAPAPKKPRAKVKRPEDKLHTGIARELKRLLPPVVVWWSNESRGVGFKEGARRKARGVKAGVPDMEFHFPGQSYPEARSCFIELKAEAGALNEAQKDMHAALRDTGHLVYVCRSLDEVLEVLKRAGCPMRVRL